jgi:hypothetical protein
MTPPLKRRGEIFFLRLQICSVLFLKVQAKYYHMDIQKSWKNLALPRKLFLIGAVVSAALSTYLPGNNVTSFLASFWNWNGLKTVSAAVASLPYGLTLLYVLSLGVVGYGIGYAVENRKQLEAVSKKWPQWVVDGLKVSGVVTGYVVLVAVVDMFAKSVSAYLTTSPIAQVVTKISEVGGRPTGYIVSLLSKVFGEVQFTSDFGLVVVFALTVFLGSFILGAVASYLLKAFWKDYQNMIKSPLAYFGLKPLHSPLALQTVVVAVLSVFIVGAFGFPVPFIVEGWQEGYGYGNADFLIHYPVSAGGGPIEGANCYLNPNGIGGWNIAGHSLSRSSGHCVISDYGAGYVWSWKATCPTGEILQGVAPGGAITLTAGATTNKDVPIACGGVGCTVTNAQARSQCYNGDIWYYDNCAQRSSVKQSCSSAGQVCIQDTQFGARCVSCIPSGQACTSLEGRCCAGTSCQAGVCKATTATTTTQPSGCANNGYLGSLANGLQGCCSGCGEAYPLGQYYCKACPTTPTTTIRTVTTTTQPRTTTTQPRTTTTIGGGGSPSTTLGTGCQVSNQCQAKSCSGNDVVCVNNCGTSDHVYKSCTGDQICKDAECLATGTTTTTLKKETKGCGFGYTLDDSGACQLDMVTVGVFAIIILVLVVLVSGGGKNASQDIVRIVERAESNIGIK